MFIIKCYRAILAQLIKSLTKAADVTAKEAALAREGSAKLLEVAAAADKTEASLRAEVAKFQSLQSA